MSLLESPEGVGGAVVVLLGGGLKLVTAYLEWRKTRDAKRAMSLVPPSPQVRPPESDPGVLARLDQLDAQNVLSVALHHARSAVDDRDRRIAQLEREVGTLATQLKIERAGRGIANGLLRAKDEQILRLQEDVARERARRRGSPVEVSAAEYRDASEAGSIQDSLRTPLRPPKP